MYKTNLSASVSLVEISQKTKKFSILKVILTRLFLLLKLL